MPDKSRSVIDQEGNKMLQKLKGGALTSRMLRSGKWKYIHFHKHDSDDLLFDLENGPHEQANAIERAGGKAEEL